MEFVEAMKIRVRMCTERPSDYFSCSGCPLSSNNNGVGMNCTEFLMYHPEKAEEILTKWAEEHPQKTILQDFLEKYPNAKLDKNGFPKFCPFTLGFCDNGCEVCVDVKDCWNRPLED